MNNIFFNISPQLFVGMIVWHIIILNGFQNGFTQMTTFPVSHLRTTLIYIAAILLLLCLFGVIPK